MIGFNHGLVGGLIGKYTPWPLAIPLALASHFALDILPHYGMPHIDRDGSKFWKWFFIFDFIATFCLALWAILNAHYAMLFSGLAAVIPDFVWVAKVIRHHTFNLKHHNSRFEQWHIAIQKHEYTWGVWVELAIASPLFYIVILQTT